MSHFYEFGPFCLDADKRLLQKNGEPVSLTPKVIDTLFVLVENPGVVLEKERLMNMVWADSFVEEGNLTVNISTLRKVLGERPHQPQYIMTVPGRGYRFVAYVKESFERDADIIAQESTRSQILIQSSEVEVPEAVASEAAPRSLLARILRLDGKAGLSIGQRAKTVAIVGASLALLVLFALVPQALKLSTGKVINSVAVLPFVNETNDDSTEYLGDSFADMLISSLSRLPELKVVSRNSVTRYRGQEADAVSVGSELKVRALVIGRLYKVGNQLYVVVEFTDTSDGTVLWSQRYNQNSSNILSMQRDIARNIIGKLRKESGGEVKKGLAPQTTSDPAAYDLYLKGRWYWNKRTWAGVQQAIAHYEQALELDPDFALAYAGLADVYALTGGVQPHDSYLKAKAAAERALQLDGTLGEAHATLGFIKSHYDRDWAAADAEFRQAIELSPNHPTAHHWNASQLMARGEFDLASQEFNRALELDPLSPIINTDLGLCHFFRRDYDTAVAHLQRVCDQFPNFYMAHYHLAWAYTQKGAYEEAVAEYQRALELSRGHSMVEAMLGYTYALSGRRGEAERVLTKLQALARDQYVSPYRFAMIYTALGEKDQAFEWLNRACNESDFLVIYAGVSPFTDPLRGDPRFTAVLRRLRLAP